MNINDTQLLSLIHQVQSHQISNIQALLLGIAYSVPVSSENKLAIYKWLFALSLPEISSFQFTLILILAPVFIVGLFFITILFIRWIYSSLIPYLLTLFGFQTKNKKILQLTFPSDAVKSAFATEQFYSLLHSLSKQHGFWDRFIQRKNQYSLEIVSTKKEGIRYLIVADEKFIEIIRRNLLSYLPGIKINETKDYFDVSDSKKSTGLVEFKLSSHFALPLSNQKTLSENDPISYITGNMANLAPDEIVSFQIVINPVMADYHKNIIAEIKSIRQYISQCRPLADVVKKGTLTKILSFPVISVIWTIIKFPWTVLLSLLTLYPLNPIKLLNPYEKELAETVKSKIDQQLFETSIRLFVISSNEKETKTRIDGLVASLGQLNNSNQSLLVKKVIVPWLDKRLQNFRNRLISLNLQLNQNPVLSVSELTDLFHFPFTDTTKTEDLVKSHSKELPAPLSVKNNSAFDVVFGKNKFAGVENDIGLTDDDRSRHVYIIGQTGSGKTTIIYHMAKDDIQKGRGVAVIDPHGDLAEDLLNCVPESRFNDCIYLNPFDIRHPIGINLLELKQGLDEDELEQEKELVCESVISVFRRIFSKDENTDAHRIEYILRNTIYTAFSVKESTIFTVYDLLNDPSFRDRVLVTLEDENLKNFWANEFGKAGNYQAVKMAAGVTTKIGRFLFSPTAKRMLEQPKSTINFDDILSTGKILICNLAEGKLGEDTSQLIGTTIISKLQQAAMRRVRLKASTRTPFYIFVDEFQNFATTSFIKLLSGGRKFGLRLTIAEQSTAQQDDRNIVNVILANTGTVICFRTASPVDEQLMLSQFSPYVKQGDIVNLPRFRFYMKLSAVEPEEPFSGETIPITLQHDNERVEHLVDSSRNNYAIVYKKPLPKIKVSKIKVSQKRVNIPEKNDNVGSLV